MTTPQQSTGISTFDNSTLPYRPGLPDFNGASLADRADAPPNPGTMPTANLLNGTGMLICAVAQVTPNAVLSLKYVAGAPVLDYGSTAAGITPNTVGPIQAGKIVIVRTPGGASAGDVIITYPTAALPATTFPAPAFHPMATLNGIAPGGIAAEWYTPSYTAWSAGEAVSGSTYNVPTVANGFVYKVTTVGSGTTGGVQPTWPTVIGQATTPDANGVVFTCWAYLNGARVVTVNMSNVATDLPFTVALG